MKTHWKKLDNPNYLGAYSLMDGETKEITVTIEIVKNEEVKNERGSENCRVVYFKEKKVGNIDMKPMILNTTNSKLIEKIHQTPYIEDWKGKQITIYVAKIKAFGDMLDALRIREKLPTLPELIPNSENWKQVITALKNGFTIEQVKTKYSISKQNEKLLSDETI